MPRDNRRGAVQAATVHHHSASAGPGGADLGRGQPAQDRGAPGGSRRGRARRGLEELPQLFVGRRLVFLESKILY